MTPLEAFSANDEYYFKPADMKKSREYSPGAGDTDLLVGVGCSLAAPWLLTHHVGAVLVHESPLHEGRLLVGGGYLRTQVAS